MLINPQVQLQFHPKGGNIWKYNFLKSRLALKDAERRKLSFKRQIEELEAKVSKQSISIQAEELVEEAKKVLQSLNFDNKIVIVRDIIDKVIIKERSEVEVWAHVPLFDLKLGYEPKSRDSWIA